MKIFTLTELHCLPFLLRHILCSFIRSNILNAFDSRLLRVLFLFSIVKSDKFQFFERSKIIIDKKLPSQVKELKEAKGLITAAYQDYLETTWLDELRKKYPITIDKEILYSITNKQ